MPITAIHEAFPSHGRKRGSYGSMSWASTGGFTPSGSPVGHWSADTITGLEDDDPVATWPDQANSYDLVQETAAKKPTYKTDIQNSLPCVRFDGTSDTMAVAYGSTLSQPNTFFSVHDFTQGGTDIIFDGIYGDNEQALYCQAGQMHSRLDAGSPTLVDPYMFQTGSPDLNVILFNGASSWFRQNGVQSNNINPGAENPIGLTLGSGYGGNFGWAQVDYFEFIAYDGTETVTDNEAGLKSKWGTP